MPKIIDNVLRRKAEFQNNPVLVGQNVAMAIAAMTEGVKSSAWENYMKQYARDASGNLDIDQLARLTAADDTGGDHVMDRKRCYLVGNALCGMTTIDTLEYAVQSIDERPGQENCSRYGSPCDDPDTSQSGS